MIYPQPKQLTKNEGVYQFTGLCPDDLLEFYSLCKEKQYVNFETLKTLGYEEHILKITPEGIFVISSSDEGTFRALTTLYMLIKTEGNELSCIEVHDSPDFEKRGYMLDISRGRIPKVSTVKKLIDNLVLLKYNELQLYIESFVFKYPLIPAVTEGFDCLTPEDIVEIEKYCNERFVDLVPNQNCLGHMHNWLARDEYKHLSVGNGAEIGTINPYAEGTTELVNDIFDSLLPYFKSEYVNVGLDEAVGLGKFELEEICKEKGVDGVFMDYLNDINERVGKKHGKKLMFWADMITNYPDSFHRIPKDAIALEWDYELIQSQVMAEHCLALKEKGATFYVCPSANTHFSYTGRADVTTFNLRTCGEVGKKYGAKGYLVTEWGCGLEGHPHYPVWHLFPQALGGQYAWNVGCEQNGEKFKPEFIYGAKDYVDFFHFNGKKVSELLYRMSNYYLLEPERIHLGTMCAMLFPFPIEVKNYSDFFHLDKCGNDFYFDNVIKYVESIIPDIEKIDFDIRNKREILVNAKMVVLATMLCKIKLRMKVYDEEVEKICSLIDWIAEEFKDLWMVTNYEHGIEICLSNLANRKKEILALPRI